MNYSESLKFKVSNHDAKIMVIGIGYVGLPLALAFANCGLKTYALDNDSSKISSLASGKSYIKHIPSAYVHQSIKTGNFYPTVDIGLAADADVIIICVPTPLNKYREPNLVYIKDSIEQLLPHLRKGQLISLESTTYPGTTEELISLPITACGFTPGNDIFIVYSPEREDPGNNHYGVTSIPKVVGGMTSVCTEVACHMYSQIIQTVVPVSNPMVAEMSKLLENIHRAVNIGLVNELKPLAAALNIDLFEVIEAAATKPFGFVPYYPGPGLGGHCIPIDPFYLTWKAREYDINTRFIELAGQINAAMPSYIVNQTLSVLNLYNKTVNRSRILVMGLAYKKNVDDTRESPSLKIVRCLLDLGAHISYVDPYCSGVISHPIFGNNTINEISHDCIDYSMYDVTLLLTDHDCFDYCNMYEGSLIIIDTRGRFKRDHKVFRA
jgi:UDP-N-acetyl-D-glucosamine dehydrogenase